MDARNLDPGLYFVPLGGCEEFGVNLNVYICNGRILIADCGIGFAGDRFPGVDILLPDPAFLVENKKNIDAMVITHAHEDHVGAVAHLWPRLRCPVYCSAFTAQVLKGKCHDAGIRDMEIRVVDPQHEQNSRFSCGPFALTALSVAHSIPQAFSLQIETEHGRVIHSGDWNLDPAPVVGTRTDADAFRKAGDAGVLAYIGDSTNACVDGRTASESEVREGLEALFRECTGRIAVTIFASNVGRVQSVCRAAQVTDRHVGLIGRSLRRMVSCAHECGYLSDLPPFVSEEELGYLPNEKVVMIVTGSQGEPQAALARISRGDHREISLSRGDTVIFSSRPIPGNDKDINEVKNNLSASGIRVIAPSDTAHTIHVSGHPRRDEVRDMLAWVRPQIVVPVHGERLMLDGQAELAQSAGVPHEIVPNNGSLIRLAPGAPEIVDHVHIGLLAIEPNRIIDANHKAIHMRRKLQYSGAVHATVILDARGEMVTAPHVTSMGLCDPEDPEDTFDQQMEIEIEEVLEDMNWEERVDDDFVYEEMRIALRRFVKHHLGVKTQVSIHLVRL